MSSRCSDELAGRCGSCDRAFTKKRVEQLYCSNACRISALNNGWKARVVTCLNCGDLCQARSRSRKYCDACKEKHCVRCGGSFRARLFTQRFCSHECQREDLWRTNSAVGEDNDFQCPVCLRSFRKQAALSGHLCSHRKDQLRDSSSPPSCRRCSAVLTEDNWPQYYQGVNRKQYLCRACAAKEKKASNARNRSKRLAQVSVRRLAAKIRVINAYGGRCACCGEKDVDFLTMDHVNNDGKEHRKEVGSGHSIYAWLEKNDFPDGIVQVLCWNCNLGRYYGGGTCPHARLKDASSVTSDS